MVEALEEGRTGQATRVLETEFAGHHRVVVGGVMAVRNRHAATLGAAADLAGNVGNLARFGLGLAIPGWSPSGTDGWSGAG